jgi:hypothetical protein
MDSQFVLRMTIIPTKIEKLVSFTSLFLALLAWPANVDARSNFVKNGNFQSVFADWSGTAQAILLDWPSVPNDSCCLASDVYLDIPTTPGQHYLVSFDAAADLYFGPSVDISLVLNQETSGSFTTPPYPYNGSINRYDQMFALKFMKSWT